jgi:hypothetical protein
MNNTLEDVFYKNWERSIGLTGEVDGERDPEAVSMDGVEVPVDDSVESYLTNLGQTWAQMARGYTAAGAGALGETERLIQGIGEVIGREADESKMDAFLRGVQEETQFWTTEDVANMLPDVPGVEPGELQMAEQMGEFIGPTGAPLWISKMLGIATRPQKAAGMGIGTAMASEEAEGAQQPAGQYRDTFVNYLMENENAAFASGKAKTARHKSPEGGLDTVGFGHKLTAKENREGKIYGIPIKDIDVNKAKEILVKDIQRAEAQAKKNLKSMHPNVDFDSLSEDKKEMLTDIQFNVKGGGIKTFPTFVRGVVTDDAKLMKKEYKRYYTDTKGAKREVKKRNTDFFNTYLKNL